MDASQIAGGRDPQIVADVIARVMATYTVEVIAQLKSQGLLQAEDELAATQALASAPDWVRESYARAKANPTPIERDAEDVRAQLIRNRLVLALKRRGMTQADLARNLSKSPSQISRIFRNPQRSRLGTLKTIADAIKVDLSDLLQDLHTDG